MTVALRLDKLPVAFLGSQAKAVEEGKEEAKETPQKSLLRKAALEGVFSLGAGEGIFILYVTVVEISREHFRSITSL